MKLKNPLLAVKDVRLSAAFYNRVLGLRVIADFGANVTLTGGLCLQSEQTWQTFIGADKSIAFGGNDAEIYFEEENFDAFCSRLTSIDGLRFVHAVKEHGWGQRVVRFYDLDRHIIEVAEPIDAVARRFAEQGMSDGQIAERMDVPTATVKRWLKSRA